MAICAPPEDGEMGIEPGTIAIAALKLNSRAAMANMQRSMTVDSSFSAVVHTIKTYRRESYAPKVEL